MCRFDDASSQAYDVVEDAIVSFVHGSASSTSTSTPSLNSSARIDGTQYDKRFAVYEQKKGKQISNRHCK